MQVCPAGQVPPHIGAALKLQGTGGITGTSRQALLFPTVVSFLFVTIAQSPIILGGGPVTVKVRKKLLVWLGASDRGGLLQGTEDPIGRPQVHPDPPPDTYVNPAENVSVTEVGAPQGPVPWFVTRISKVNCWPVWKGGWIIMWASDLVMARSHFPGLL